MITRRQSLYAAVLAALAMQPRWAKAQDSTQEVGNGLRVVATGNVTVDQEATGSQALQLEGTEIAPGIYNTATGVQIVGNDGSITATGDVQVSQVAVGTQAVSVSADYPEYAGQPAVACEAGRVLANPQSGQVFYQGFDCCWYPVRCCS